MDKFLIAINRNSGLVQKLGQTYVQHALEDSGLDVRELLFLEPEDMESTLQDFAQREEHVLIGGGDGTFLAAAKIFMPHKKPFGLLPLGTMNLLGQDMKLPQDSHELLKDYADGIKTTEIDVGNVNGEIFLCCAAWGTIPESSEFREENRDANEAILIPRLTLFVMDQMDEVDKRRAKLIIDKKSRSIKTASLVVSNNQYMASEGLGHSFTKKSLRDGVLGIYSARPKTLWDKIRLMLRLGIGGWSQDPSIHQWSGRNVTLLTRHKKEIISLDGEVFDMQNPLEFSIEEKALPLIIPANTGEKA